MEEIRERLRNGLESPDRGYIELCVNGTNSKLMPHMKLLILSLITTPLLILTACQTPHPAPGNELSEMILHKDFQLVAQNHPEFASYCIRTVSRLEIEQSWANFKKMEAIKAKNMKAPAPVKLKQIPPTPPPLPPAPSPNVK